METQTAVVIFTDLDASLLDHEGYGLEGAATALLRIKTLQIPLIVVTSKSRLEVEQARKELGIEDPFIVENGAALYVPQGYRGLSVEDGRLQGTYTVVTWGLPYGRIRSFVTRVRQDFPITGFGDMDTDQVARLTGLPPDKAALARQREFSEPFVRLRHGHP